MKPQVDYSHVLSELSVNREDPCEVIRELISNSYDALANKIVVFPILQHQGFVFADNGIGVDDRTEIRGITPWIAFFSIGRSTKTLGESIGYKCQGTKLCFASSRFALLSKCKGEEEWRYIIIDNPKTNLTPQFDISPKTTDDPLTLAADFFSPRNNKTEAAFQVFADYFEKSPDCGTVILVRGFEAENFSHYFDPDSGKEYSYLREYVRFATRYGDMRILRPKQTGFKIQQTKVFEQARGYNDTCKLELWNGVKLESVPVGFPYIKKPDEVDSLKKPSELSRLRDGSFFSRHAGTFRFEGDQFYLTLAVDGNRRALDEYSTLDRRGRAGYRSGIRFTDQRGTFVCSQGVKVCPINFIFDEAILSDSYSVLGSDDAQTHFIFMINGNFELVTNRNTLAEISLKKIRSSGFLEQVRKFLDNARQDETFRQLIQRLLRETEIFRIEKYLEQFYRVRDSIKDKERFRVRCAGPLNNQWIVAPEVGGEHWVGALYTLFAYHVPLDSAYAEFWLKPRTFSGRGIDSFAVPLNETNLDGKTHRAVEYKWRFAPSDEFNHPLIATDDIVAWELQGCANGKSVEDAYEYFGTLTCPAKMAEIGFQIEDIQSRSGEINEGIVRIISLKDLIEKTFDTKWTLPPPRNPNGK